MRVAIVHDISLVFGGAERVLVSLLRMHPHSDVYVGFISDVYKKYLGQLTDGKIISSPYNHAPWATMYPDVYKPLLLLWWEYLDMSQYDLVIALSHAYSSKSVRPADRTRYIAYIFTPPRFLWGVYNESQWIHWPLIRLLLSPLFSWMRKKDVEATNRPDIVVATSKTTQQRIKKIYKRDSVVVYPPVSIPQKLQRKKPRYYLCISRLVKQKGIDIAIAACNTLGAPLVVVGTGKEEHALQKLAGPTIQFLGFVPDEDMGRIYEGAKALLYLSHEEDFGLVPVEAMAHGVPVVASSDGGAKETVIHGKTGLLLHSLTVSSVIDALRIFERQSFSPLECRKQAIKFSEGIFRKNMRRLVQYASS